MGGDWVPLSGAGIWSPPMGSGDVVRVQSRAAWKRVHRLQDGFQAEQAEEHTRRVRAEFEREPSLSFDDFGKGYFTLWVSAGVLEPV